MALPTNTMLQSRGGLGAEETAELGKEGILKKSLATSLLIKLLINVSTI